MDSLTGLASKCWNFTALILLVKTPTLPLYKVSSLTSKIKVGFLATDLSIYNWILLSCYLMLNLIKVFGMTWKLSFDSPTSQSSVSAPVFFNNDNLFWLTLNSY